MRLGQISILMASVSIAIGVMLYVKVDRLDRDFRNQRSRDVRGADATAAEEFGAVELPPRVAEADRAAVGGEPARTGTARTAAPARPAPTFEARLARLEEQQKALEAAGGLPWHGHQQSFARTVDDLAQQLSLTPTQRSRIEDAVSRGKQRIEDVLKIPDETGKSPFERRTEARKKLEEAMKNPQPGGFLAFASDMTSYQGRKIPGRNETYGDEIRRIRKETRDEIVGALDSKQQETFSQTNVDGLMGEPAQVSFAVALGDDADASPAGMIVDVDPTDSTDQGAANGPEGGASGSR